MSHKERMLHMVLFELAALILMAVAATYIVGGGAVKWQAWRCLYR